MAFETVVQRRINYTSAAMDPVRMALYCQESKAKGQKGEPYQFLEFIVSAHAAARLKWVSGLSRLLVQEGTGVDEGFLRISLAENGDGIAFSKRNKEDDTGSGAFRINVKSLTHNKVMRGARAILPVDHNIFGTALTVMILPVLEDQNE